MPEYPIPSPETIAAVLSHIAQLKLEAMRRDPHPNWAIESFTPVCCSQCGAVKIIQHSDVPTENTGQLLGILARLLTHRPGCVVPKNGMPFTAAELAVILRPVQ
jgi:hypothetical protein